MPMRPLSLSRARPGRGQYWQPPGGREWMERAACTPDPAWTADITPAHHVLARLAAICATCPVSRECAAYALSTPDVDCGMYGGVWLPHRHDKGGSRRWQAAIIALAAIAGGHR